MGRIHLLSREKETVGLTPELASREEAGKYVDVLLSHMQRGVEGDLTGFYDLILTARRYDLRLADIAYLLLELKSVGKQILFENVPDELSAFRVARLVDDTVEGILRRSADLYELASQADQKAAQERLQEMFAAWEFERAVMDAKTPAALCERIAAKLAERWRLVGVRLRVLGRGPDEERDLTSREVLPVPQVQVSRQYLTSAEIRGGGTIDIIEATRRRRDVILYEDLGAAEEVTNAAALLDAGVGSLATCPLVCRGLVIGVMLLYGAGRRSIPPEDGRALADVADVLGVVLDTVRRVEHSEKVIGKEEVIARIGRALLELPTRGALLQSVVEALRDFRDYFDVSLFRVDADTNDCVLVAEAGRGRRYRPAEYRQSVGTGFIGICAQTGQTIRADDLQQDQRRLVAFDEEHRARSELAVPISGTERVYGVLHLLSDRDHDFPDSDVAAIEHVAPHIGVALRNAWMISQRRHDQYEIERAHQELSNIIRSTAVGITGIDPNGVFTHWSPSCESMLGYSAEEVIGRMTPSDLAEEPYDLQAALEACRRTGQTMMERPLRRKDGVVRIIRETVAPLQDEEARHIGFTSYLVDVTEQRRAEQRIRAERDTLALVVGAMGAGLALFDGDLRLQWANSTLMEWFGVGEEALGKTCHDIYHCGHEDLGTCPVKAVMERGEPQVRLQDRTDRSGAWRCYQHVLTPIEHGETHLIVLSMDITDQRRQTEHLRLVHRLVEQVETSLEMDRVLHLLLTGVTAGHAIGLNRAFIFLQDEEGHELRGTMAVGPVSAHDARRIWEGLAATEEAAGQLPVSGSPSESDKELTDLVSELSIPLSASRDVLVSTLLNRTSAHVGNARTELHMQSEVVEALGLGEFVCVPLVAQSEPVGIILADNKYSGTPVTQDQVELLEMLSRQASLAIANARSYEKIRDQLAELRRTRDRLIEAERMASVGRMASHLAHEIRNPLTAIGGFATAIARQHETDSKTHRNAMVIYEETKRLERTLANVLDYTRPLRPSFQSVDVNALVEETVDQFRTELEENGISLGLSLSDRAETVQGDTGMLKQVVINLIKNAIQSMEGVAAKRLTVTTGRQGDEVLITVSDNGSGMSQDTIDKLFSPFFTTKVGGIGLGLSISQRIARQHGGRIDVSSETGRGSRFRIVLPTGEGLQQEQEKAAAVRGQAERGGNDGRYSTG